MTHEIPSFTPISSADTAPETNKADTEKQTQEALLQALLNSEYEEAEKLLRELDTEEGAVVDAVFTIFEYYNDTTEREEAMKKLDNSGLVHIAVLLRTLLEKSAVSGQ